MTDMQLDMEGNEVPWKEVAKPKRRGGQAGRARERQVADKLRSEDWVVVKGTTYGVADLVALKAGMRPMLIEVKSTAGGPYERFPPSSRVSMLAEAERAGANAVLAWWPPRGKMRLIFSGEWPR
jgi:Holliday junction resolvase